jgi:ribokinase
MAPVDLLTAGEAFEDLVFLDLPRLPQPGEELKTSRFVRTVGGGAVITAVAAARLGIRCAITSALSPTAVALLTREGVKVVDLRKRGELPAITAALSTPRNRTFVTFNGVNDALEKRLRAPLRAAQARHVHCAFYPVRSARWVGTIASLRARGISTSWDFGWDDRLPADRDFYRLLAAVDYVFVNEQEALLYSGSRSLPDAFAFWKSSTHVTIVKLGPRGSRWISRNLEHEEPAPTVKTVDTTGAGDAFNGGFLAARLRGRAPRASLQAGNRVGAMSTRAAGGIDALPRRVAR